MSKFTFKLRVNSIFRRFLLKRGIIYFIDLFSELSEVRRSRESLSISLFISLFQLLLTRLLNYLFVK